MIIVISPAKNLNENYNLTTHDDLVSRNGNHSLNKLNNVEHALILLMNDPNYYNYQFIKDLSPIHI